MVEQLVSGSRYWIKALLVLATGAFLLLVVAASAGAASGERYIVVLKDEVANPADVASEHGRRYDVAANYVYRAALKGYAGTIPAARVDSVRSDSRVAYVERDGTARIAAKPAKPGKPGGEPAPQTLPWGIDRIDADLSSTLAGNGSGAVSNVSAYVIDTGIDQKHSDLNVVGHVNFAGGKNTDCHGHGTHVAGTVAAADNSADVVGAVPGAPLTGVKVLSCSGSGTYSGVIAGVDWVTANAVKPAVANMSLGGSASQAVDDAVRESAAAGITYALAAGNDGADACQSSPARAGAGTDNGIVTVAATNSSDAETSWSNYGPCVDIWGPGASVLSTKKGGGTTTMSGTSMASPHVAGTAGLYLSANTAATPVQVETQLRSDAASPGTTSKDGVAVRLAFAGLY